MRANSNIYFSELGTQAIELGLADPVLSSFYDSILAARPGRITQQLKPYMPFLSLCSDTMTTNDPPPIFYVGKESGQRRIFGETWAENPSPDAALRTPDHRLEQASADGYRKALQTGAYYGYARTKIDVDGRAYDVAFERLILAIRPSPRSDYRFCAYFGVIQDLHRTL